MEAPIAALALRATRAALAVQEAALGSEHPKVLASLSNLARLLHAQERYADAETLYRRTLKAHDHALGSEHPEVASLLNSLHGLYLEQGRYHTCPRCGGEDVVFEKDTFSGREIRSYYCPHCKWMKDEDRGIALWKILSGDG